MKKLISIAVMALALAACGTNNAETGADNVGTLEGKFEYGTVIVDGKTLTCVSREVSAYDGLGFWCFPPAVYTPLTP